MSETRSEDRRPLKNHRQPFFYASDGGLIKVECRCGWKGYFDDGKSMDDWMTHLYDSSVEEYDRE